MSQVPDCIFPSSSYEGFADLDYSLQGDVLDYPMIWGSHARTKSYQGRTIIFYTDDYRFNALGNAVTYGDVFWKLWERPSKIWTSGAPSFCEVNFSTSQAQPFWVAANCIGKKRHLSRLFQEMGNMRCWVDLNVAPRWEELNLVGVPRGWKAWMTHMQKFMDEDMLIHQYELACAHAQSDNIKFVVYAHNKEVERLCMTRGWQYVPEDWKARDESKRQKRITASEKAIRIEPLQPKKIGLEMWC